MYLTESDKEMLARWSTAEFKGDYVCSLPISRAQRLLDILKHIPQDQPATEVRKRRGFRDGDMGEGLGRLA